MALTTNDPDPDSGAMRPEDMVEYLLAHMSQHVMVKIGMGAAENETGRSMTLHPSPMITENDGHVDFGVLGIFFDMAASGAFEGNRGGVHADISVTRLRPPTGVMVATARPARAGRRTGVVEVDLHDETGALVATSTQEIVFREMMGGEQSGLGDAHRAAMDQMRERFRVLFDGTCTLERSLGATLGIERRSDSWHLTLAEDRTNGGGALHGGCGIATQHVRVLDAGQEDRAVMLADVVSVAQ